MTTSEADTPPLGLRERKKARTRDALIDAALRLFGERGYTATTTEEIAAAADVSQRTFFRYFAGKEEVVLAAQDAIEEVFQAKFAARPPTEQPFTALGNAVHDAWTELDANALETQMLMVRLIDECPQLLAAHLRRSSEHQDRLVAEIARRAGVDPVADPRPRLVAAAFGSATHVAHTLWCQRGGDDLAELLATGRDCVERLVPALTEPWHAERAAGTGR
ncbi:AcrR family transcriptional regulator [Spinactinospora alkalitolerans]|uniref:AcrR family transcriptional regulator n=1 Tax=Spinactinospora alkalitolerans TaxID=687207 RepID=A0A852TRK9_9ACTN|nr:TetR family transcriptional regulator [Spinactinospora alkalitolerans]NYE46191.1 AcrR family transcriptional regulator [Spinactinospora alkalitolerans]